MMNTFEPRIGRRRLLQAATLAGLPSIGAGALAQQAEGEPSQIWAVLRKNLFDDRAIRQQPGLLTLELPRRAADAAVVPFAVWAADTPLGRSLRKLHLVIDENPSPVMGVFDFAPGHGPIGLETRVRIDAYSYVRAIAETGDGQLFEETRFVKASGGCSAPAGKDAEAALANLGRMRIRLPEVMKAGETVTVQLMAQHPNHSGMAMDQLSRMFTPAHYVHQVAVSFEGEPVWAAEVNFSISENPNFRFHFTPKRSGRMVARLQDTQGKRFELAVPVRLDGAVG
jgi:sulfur-oxidizing protein SoxY